MSMYMHSAHPRVPGEAAHKVREHPEHGSESLHLVEVVLALEDLVHGLEGVGVLEAKKEVGYREEGSRR
jgi:hypothetical protein